ncbi:Glycosyltransferase CpoA [Alteracholeplasma palmae J233]|uniref:Glycosyltransferase CpoA n=1 Tax=Alteracholeplasma palmae (strain ATCC 49389 / J233) TaxID=1318466 RepID=U4KLA2_ALTPJ|nr:glycosyltransferase family 4 protein [Alteracholeplasma palmae]CCV64684.1 Glycosyltransferase CpoA [Alteracholeplasma palmae J233]
MENFRIRMSFVGEKIEGQGVLSATLEQISLIDELCKEEFSVSVNKGKYDLFHAHTVNPRNYFAAKYSSKPVITHVHFLPETFDGSIKLPKFLMKLFYQYFLKIYKKSDYLVLVNPIFSKKLIEFGVDPLRIKYIPNFVSEKNFYEMASEEKLGIRSKYNYTQDDFVVLGVGQVQTRKGVMDFLEIAKAMPHLKFIWVGGFSFGAITDGYKEFKKAIDDAPSNVKFTDIIPRSEMNGIYNMADILFVPSYNELFPMAILEACSTNTPLLLRNLDLYEDILFKYYQGDSNEKFIELLSKLSEKTEDYEIAKNYSNKIKTYYSRENIKKLWVDLYQEVYQEYKDNKFKRSKQNRKIK